MAAGALARVARRQGQRGLLAWRAAVAELQAAAQVPREQQAEPGCSAAATWLQQQWQQQACGLHALAGTSSSSSPAAVAGGGAAALAPAGPLPLPWLRQQRRGMALNFARYQPRRRKQQQEERNLPEKNEEIKVPEVRVLFPDPEQPSEVMPTKRALKLAQAQELDLVMVSPRAVPPVARITDFSKVLYEAQKRDKAAAKQALAARRAADPKEVRISCQIAQHDLGVKMAQARKFLEEGNLLRLVVLFKGGPQIALGHEVTLYLIGQLSDLAKVRDERHLQRPQRGQWAVMLEPLPPEKPSNKKDKPAAAADAADAAGQQGVPQAEQAEAGQTAAAAAQ